MPNTVGSVRKDLSDGKKRRGRPKDADKGAIPLLILQAALLMFKKQGFDATSVEQIAAAAGASKTTIYRHFRTKEALAEAAVVQDGQNVLETIRAIDNADPDPLVRLRTLTFGIADFAALPNNADLYRLSLAAVPRVPAIGRAFAATGAALRALMQPHVEAAQAAGLLRQGDSEQLARQLYDAVVNPIWSDALLLTPYVDDEAQRAAVMQANWESFLRGARA
ncbi:TetR/AcrR family transcriptional regulator [Devosia geojensis]|uniref:TetR/AcrR family transcriptional regulator n=1 Tax=Devosia geojensis TaxID=443610 RepID=UPI0006981963|nr:TetR/AcrR family transcriptional regulator [Devosia geojensis]